MRKKPALIGLLPALALALSAGCESAPLASQDRVHTITDQTPAFTLASEELDDAPAIRLGAGDHLGHALFDRYLASLEEPRPTPHGTPRLAEATPPRNTPSWRAWIVDWLDSAS